MNYAIVNSTLSNFNFLIVRQGIQDPSLRFGMTGAKGDKTEDFVLRKREVILREGKRLITPDKSELQMAFCRSDGTLV
jgi:hypothetical protein